MRIIRTLICLLPCILCVISSAVLYFYKIEGAGWFLFVSVLLYPSMKFDYDKNKNDETKKELKV